MANYVKISTIGPKLHQVGAGTCYKDAVEMIIGHLGNKIAQVLPDNPDVIVLPEVCDLPFEFQGIEDSHEYYRVRGDRILEYLSGIARNGNCYIFYPSIREINDGSWRNSIRVIDRKGEVLGIYSKNHPTIDEITDAGIKCGMNAPVFKCDFGRVACAICFDLNFDELRLKYARAKPDLLVFCSAYHGGLMQNYWAYSCRAYFVGAVIGYNSAVISPVGRIIASSTNYFDYATAVVNLDCAVVHLDYNWTRITQMKQKYGTRVKVADPGELGSVLISSETDELTINDMMGEFGIEVLDDYFKRALTYHHAPGNIESRP